MPRNLPALRSLILAAVIGLAGCATINAGVDPWARQAGVTAGAPVLLFGRIGEITIYGDGAKDALKVVITENPSFSSALGNAIRQSAAEARAGSSPSGSATWTRQMNYAPAVYLDQKGTHRLQVVRSDGRTAVVVLKPHIRTAYFVVDWLLVAPSLFTSIIIDAATGKWKVFDPIDVDALFQGAAGDAESPTPTTP